MFAVVSVILIAAGAGAFLLDKPRRWTQCWPSAGIERTVGDLLRFAASSTLSGSIVGATQMQADRCHFKRLKIQRYHTILNGQACFGFLHTGAQFGRDDLGA